MKFLSKVIANTDDDADLKKLVSAIRTFKRNYIDIQEISEATDDKDPLTFRRTLSLIKKYHAKIAEMLGVKSLTIKAPEYKKSFSGPFGNEGNDRSIRKKARIVLSSSPKWRSLTDEEIKNEYAWEYSKQKSWSEDAFPTVQDFKKAVKAGTPTTLTKAMDAKVEYRSHSESLEELKDLVSGYQFPRDVDRIVRGIKEGASIPYPIVLKKKGRLRVMSGNTRLDVAFILGVEPTVLIVDIGGKSEAQTIKVAIEDLLPDKNNMEVAVDSLHRGQYSPETKPIDVYKNGNSYIVADGHHRLLQAILEGESTVTVKLLPETKLSRKNTIELDLNDGRFYGLDSLLENGWRLKRI